MINKLIEEIEINKNPKKAEILQKFFKTGKGEYAEGDIFYGITVPELRKVVKRYFRILSYSDINILLKSKIHEERFIGVVILNEKFKIGNDKEKKEIFDFYIKNTKNINNWDLVDISAPNIVGKYLQNKNRNILYKLSKSSNLWERRIAIVSTFYFIRNNDFEYTINISLKLIRDKHDLIHKACGWMLRELGKRDEKILKDFLKENLKILPRTTLRYAIEKFNKEDRAYFMGTGTHSNFLK